MVSGGNDFIFPSLAIFEDSEASIVAEYDLARSYGLYECGDSVRIFDEVSQVPFGSLFLG